MVYVQALNFHLLRRMSGFEILLSAFKPTYTGPDKNAPFKFFCQLAHTNLAHSIAMSAQ